MLIIDGDLYVYKAGFAHRGKEIGFRLTNRQTKEEIDLGNISLTEAKLKCKDGNYKREEWKLQHYNEPIPLEYTLGNLNSMIEKLMERFGNPEYKMFLTSSDYSNYRFKIATIQPYKGTRSKCVKCFEKCSSRFDKNKNIIYTCKHCGDIDKESTFSDKPHYYNEIRDHLIRRWNAELVTGQEADDAVSILARERHNSGLDATMVHIDKDINNTPGWHYNPDEDREYHIDKEMAIRNFYTQFLLGDNIDCIPGVKGIGKILAAEILENCEIKQDYEETIMKIYMGENSPIKKFKNTMSLLPEEAYSRLTEVGQLLHIRQIEGELWQPTIQL